MAADGLVKPPRDQQALFGSRITADRSAQQTGDFSKTRPHVIGRTRRPEYRCACRTLARLCFLNETFGCVDPAKLRDHACAEKHKPGTACTCCRVFQPRSHRLRGRYEPAARSLLAPRSPVARRPT